MNSLIRRLLGGAMLAGTTASCSHPLQNPASSTMSSTASTFLGIDLPPTQREFEIEDRPTLPDLDRSASLRDCLVFAAWSSPRLESAFHHWQATLARVPQVAALPDPNLNYGYFVESIQTRTGPMEQQIALSQSFPWWGLLEARGDAATHAAAAQWHAYESVRLQLFERITQAWTAAVDLKAEVATTQASMRLLEDSESIARTAYEVDRMPHDALLRMQVELGRLEDRLHRLASMRVPRRAALNAAIGRPADAPLALPKTVHQTNSKITMSQAVARLQVNQPLIQALDATIAQHAKSAEVAKLSGLPQWTLGVSIIGLGDAVNTTLPDSGKNPVMATVGLSLPIWRDKYEAAELEATSNRLAAAALRAATLHDLHADLTEAVYQRDDATARITRYTIALLPRAEDAVAVSSQALAAGTGSSMDVLDAQRTLLELQRTLDRSRAEAVNYEATIARLIGGTPEMIQ